jgi:hypothetical protein
MLRRRNSVLGIVVVIATLAGTTSCNTGHPMPYNEIYEARDPDTHRPVLRISNTKWDGWINGIVVP